jgi:glutaredoxin
LSSGRVAAAAVSREAFETAALAQLPPGEHSAWPRATAPPPPAEEPSPGAPAAGAAPRGTAPGAAAAGGGAGAAPVVTIYGTSWCGACKAARSYLAERKVPFADKDIERDPAAAAELREKAARLGVPADRVPILDVRGRLLVGFDRARLEALLGQPS